MTSEDVMDLTTLDLGQCIDELYKVRGERLAREKEVDALKAEEERVRKHLIDSFEKVKLEGARGKLATAAITRTTVPQVKDWGAFTDYIKQTGEFDLLERRPARLAYRERLDAGVSVPGVEPFVVVNLSLTKSEKE